MFVDIVGYVKLTGFMQIKTEQRERRGQGRQRAMQNNKKKDRSNFDINEVRPGRYCSPRRQVPSDREQGFTLALDVVVRDTCQALSGGHGERGADGRGLHSSTFQLNLSRSRH
jgi:hypothetical protein